MVSLCNDTSLWDSDLVWFNSWPQFTDCFQETVLVWVPCGWLWLTSPFYIYYLRHVKPSVLSSRWKFILRMFTCACLVLFSIVQIVERASNDDSMNFAAALISPMLQTATFIYALFLMYMERRKGLVTSGIFFFFWLLLTVTGIVPFYTQIIQKEDEADLLKFTIFYIYYALVLISLIFSCLSEDLIEGHYNTPPCPEVPSSFISRITFWWVNSLLLTGYRKVLTETDIRDLHPREKIENNMPQFLSVWNPARMTISGNESDGYQPASYTKTINHPISFQESNEKTPLLGFQHSVEGLKDPPSGERKKTTLTMALLKTFWPDLLQSQIWKLFYDLLNVSNPLLLGQLISFTEDKYAPEWKGYALGVILFCSLIIQSLTFHATWHQSTSVCLRARAVITSAIFRKALTMSNQARRESTLGEIVNLMSVDTENIRLMIQNVWHIWSCALEIVLSLVLLYFTVGLPMLAGLGLLAIVVPLNYVMVSKWQGYQRSLMKLKDDRMKIVNEVLNGIKILKLYAWEPSFKKKIMEVRNRELHDLWWLACVQAIVIFTWNMTPYIVALGTLLTYIYTTPDHYLSPQTAFVAVALLNILRFAVVALPDLLAFTIQSHVSMKRIQKYLDGSDLDDCTVQKNPNQDLALSVDNATFAWENDGDSTLQSINLKVQTGQLVAVVGQVGAGKSSLMSAICGEMEKIKGQVSIKGNIAYVPQQAWIQNDTLTNNILFGKTMKKDVYKEILDACALTPDLEILPAGDLTEIGERGINLSGGQKQRVSLARAVYNDADIYILDDPLSAVDSHVGKHIFEKLICDTGVLGKKTRLLVTHGVHWLPKVDTIIVMANGRISEVGSYEELLRHDGSFAQFLQNYLLETNNEDDSDPEETQVKREILKRLQSVKSEEESDDGKNKLPVAVPKPGAVTPKKELAQRQQSIKEAAQKEATQRQESVNDKLVEEEKVEEGKVSWKVYGIYAKAFAVRFVIVGVIIYVFFQSASIASNIWLSQWTDNPDLNNLTAMPSNSSERMDKNDFYLGIYGALGVAQATCILAFSFVWGFRCVHASRVLHNNMLDNILRAPMEFFDTTPTGRIVNRCSQDINSVDIQMPHATKFSFYAFFETLSSIIVMSYSTPIFLTVVVPLSILYYFIQVFYVNTTRQLQRLVSKTRSPIFSHFGETISGASVIRAFNAQSRFTKESEVRVDKNQQFLFYAYACQRWLGFRLEAMGAAVTLAAAMFAVASRDSLSGGLVGLSITYGLQITVNLNWLVRMLSEVENRIVSVERVNEYSCLKEEAPWQLSHHRPHSSWPQQGVVKFVNYSTRYRKGLDLVLRGISCTVQSGEKVGIVGRTGAGKSSLTLSLFRLIEAAGGQINIDGVDISTIGLHDLRKKLTILPQDPVLFAGSLRENVDPFNQYSDSEIWRALDHAHLKHFVQSLTGTLEYDCSEGGENMSVGQRQLLCLARALLKKTKILVLDEATAAVDMETDDLIQQTIRSEFKDCTVLTIAHRLNTVMDYDRILVLDTGSVAEYDTPSSLLQQRDSIFYNMAKTAGLVS